MKEQLALLPGYLNAHLQLTLFALLELYKRGEADWDQSEAFGPITVRPDSSEAVA